ncbi:MAG: 16S rRNA (adenine(1518)-N(6)/adenine(1519)-N(6))-dimethyltransferase RsmA [Bacteroidetes bacterium]|nr:16S rRNA (adenine(1518)-N(6)/adenine(1519)-N(6))-dimethyltransferase RsmA [Bacteroidota bacterium]
MKNKSKNTYSIKKKYLSASEIEALQQKEASKDYLTHDKHARPWASKQDVTKAPEKASSPVRAKKHLGQHFLTDESIARKIVDSLLETDARTTVLEIGPGTGVLTKYLLPVLDKNFYALDIDQESVPYLKKTFPAHESQFLLADFLALDFKTLVPGKFNVIGNFPYNISTQIMFRVLENRQDIDCVVGMFQKEVAERIAEKPGSKTYGILSVLMQAYYDIEYLFTVHENVFSPPPKVKSAVIRLKRNATPSLPCDEALFIRVVKTAFNQRRKTLRNSLKPLVGSHTLEHDLLDKRPEQLSVEQFISLTIAITPLIS